VEATAEATAGVIGAAADQADGVAGATPDVGDGVTGAASDEADGREALQISIIKPRQFGRHSGDDGEQTGRKVTAGRRIWVSGIENNR